LVTAGLGAANHHEAALRVETQARNGGFENILVATNQNIGDLCPSIASKLPGLLHEKNPGFGYWAYKPELILEAFSQVRARNCGVLWVDAGCEINMNYLSRQRLRLYMLIARFQGAVVFELRTPETHFTKKIVRDLFPSAMNVRPNSQVQATWFFLYGEKGQKIARTWLEVVLLGEEFIDSKFDSSQEDSDFIAPRNDQSIFSLICKDIGIRPLRSSPPTGSGTKLISRVRAYTFPIWVSRNRSGQSIINRKSLRQTILS
jgi:hypothetical protein